MAICAPKTPVCGIPGKKLLNAKVSVDGVNWWEAGNDKEKVNGGEVAGLTTTQDACWTKHGGEPARSKIAVARGSGAAGSVSRGLGSS